MPSPPVPAFYAGSSKAARYIPALVPYYIIFEQKLGGMKGAKTVSGEI